MSDNIISFGNERTEAARPAKPNADLIERLEELLRQAKAGEVHDWALAWVQRIPGDAIRHVSWGTTNAEYLDKLSGGWSVLNVEIGHAQHHMAFGDE